MTEEQIIETIKYHFIEQYGSLSASEGRGYWLVGFIKEALENNRLQEYK